MELPIFEHSKETNVGKDMSGESTAATYYSYESMRSALRNLFPDLTTMA